MQLAAGMQLLSGIDRYRVSIALQQAASNAIYRGNLQLSYRDWQQTSTVENGDGPIPQIVAERMQLAPYRDRKVHYDARLMRDLIRIVIRDDGAGFDAKHIVNENDLHAISAEHGRGLVLIKNFMDKVSFNESGNEITLIKHCVLR